MFQRFVLVMAGRDNNGVYVESERQVAGDQASIDETASLLCRLAIMDGLKDIHVVGVYSELSDKLPTKH